MIIVLLGPPGVGKGTQAERICRHTQLPHISSGDILRQAVKAGTPAGDQAKAYMDRGDLVPDDLITTIIVERLEQSDCAGGVVLDGFPRTVEQSEALEAALEKSGRPISTVIYITAPEPVIVERLSGRRICKACGANFHVAFIPSAEEGVCDHCGGELYQRSDDCEEAVVQRLQVYRQQTAALISYYADRGLLAEFSGEADVEDLAQTIIRKLDSARLEVESDC